MNTDRKIAIIAGTLFIVATAASLLVSCLKWINHFEQPGLS
jgi:hypothetical protein